MTTSEAPAGAREQTRARYPDEEGYVERDGVRLFYEVYGSGEPTVLLLPTWSIIHSRHWKAQIPYLARHARVVCFDGRGNGRSDRPDAAEAYAEREFAADTLAVMEATGTERAFLVALSAGTGWAILLAAQHPERVAGIVAIGPAAPFAQHTARVKHSFDEPLETTEGWAKWNRLYWLEHYREFLEFFFGEAFSEPHSTKQIEDCVGWGLDTTPETLALTSPAGSSRTRTSSPGCAVRSAVPSWCCTATATGSGPSSWARGWPRRPAGSWSCWRAQVTSRMRATPSASTG